MVKRLYIIGLILILFLTGCVADTGTVVSVPEDNDTSNVELKLSFDTPTRAPEYYEGNRDENFLGINEGDFKVAIFNGDGEFLGILEPTQTTYPVDVEDCDAIVKGKFNKTLLRESSGLQLMMLVNWNTFGNTYPDYFDGKKLNDIFNDNVSYNYAMYDESPLESWRPSADESKGIPMFGISEKVDVNEDIKTIEFKIHLLRCMAKITVVNQLNDKEGVVDYNIKNILLSKYNRKGTLIPNVWKEEGKEISDPWLPKTENGLFDLNEGTDLSLFKEEENPETWVIYVPEADYTATAAEEKPVLNFTIEGGKKIFNKELPLFGDFYKESKSTLLRNHIYKYKITIEDKDISLGYTVCPWYGSYDTTFDYK